MPTRPVESTHDEVRHSSPAHARAAAEAEPEHPVQNREAPGVESPSADEMRGANGLPHEGNADDVTYGDQDIDTAGTAHDDLSPTKSL
jgi:hypothetical protein